MVLFLFAQVDQSQPRLLPFHVRFFLFRHGLNPFAYMKK